jgi:GR25 family glycosyltransferase involved in LPS biosynthesis
MAHINPQTMKIFIMHYTKLTKRKPHIIREFNKHNIHNYEFVEVFDKEDITEAETKLFVENKPRSNISLYMKHFHAYKEIADKYDHALIFEDDVILSDNFMETLAKYLTQLPEDYDMLFIGDGCNLHIDHHMLVPGKYIYERGVHPTTWGGGGAARCSDSYIINKKCAIKLREHLYSLKTKIDEGGIDWWLNSIARHYQLNVYWAEPTIVTQGSQNGLFSQTSNM